MKAIELKRDLENGFEAEYNPVSGSFILRADADNVIVLDISTIFRLSAFAREIEDVEYEASEEQRHVAFNELVERRMDFKGPGER